MNYLNNHRRPANPPREEFKVFLTGLSNKMTKKSLLQFFKRNFPSTTNIIMKTQKKGKGRRRTNTKKIAGFAFVVLTSRRKYNHILSEGRVFFKGRVIRAEPYLENSELQKHKEDLKMKRVFISRIPIEMSDDELSDLLQTIGPVDHAYTVKDSEDNTPRGFGYANFSTKNDAYQAVRLGKLFSTKYQTEIFLELVRGKRDRGTGGDGTPTGSNGFGVSQDGKYLENQRKSTGSSYGGYGSYHQGQRSLNSFEKGSRGYPDGRQTAEKLGERRTADSIIPTNAQSYRGQPTSHRTEAHYGEYKESNQYGVVFRQDSRLRNYPQKETPRGLPDRDGHQFGSEVLNSSSSQRDQVSVSKGLGTLKSILMGGAKWVEGGAGSEDRGGRRPGQDPSQRSQRRPGVGEPLPHRFKNDPQNGHYLRMMENNKQKVISNTNIHPQNYSNYPTGSNDLDGSGHQCSVNTKHNGATRPYQRGMGLSKWQSFNQRGNNSDTVGFSPTQTSNKQPSNSNLLSNLQPFQPGLDNQSGSQENFPVFFKHEKIFFSEFTQLFDHTPRNIRMNSSSTQRPHRAFNRLSNVRNF